MPTRCNKLHNKNQLLLTTNDVLMEFKSRQTLGRYVHSFLTKRNMYRPLSALFTGLIALSIRLLYFTINYSNQLKLGLIRPASQPKCIN